MSDDGPPENLTKEDLWNRLRRLEQHVFPSRRQILKAGGAAALVGAGAAGGASAAPGDDGDTVWGSDSNRDDYYADELDANLVSTTFVNLGADESKVKQDAFTISDDGSTTFTDFEESQHFYLLGNGFLSGHAQGILTFNNINLAASTSKISVLSNTSLTGTTGSDGDLTLSMDGPELNIENRTGESRGYRLVRLQGTGLPP